MTVAILTYRPSELQQRGYALVITLWIITLLTIIVTIAYSSARAEIRLNAYQNNQTAGEAMAQAGIWITLDSLLGSTRQNVQSGQMNHSISFSDHQIQVHIRDLAGLVNLNNASPALLRQLLSVTYLPPEENEALVQSIRDWIDADSDTPLSSNEETYYRQQGLDYSPNNRAFTTLDELRLVAGMTDNIYRQIEPFLTVYGSHSQVHEGSADAALLALLNSQADIQEGMLPDTEATDVTSGSLSGNTRFLTRESSLAYIISSSVTINGIPIENVAIIELTGRRRVNAYRILAWYGNDNIQKGI